jgi:transmembrane 9 superfamily member 2/4
MLDNLPVGMYQSVPNSPTQEKVFTRGFPVGFVTNSAGRVAATTDIKSIAPASRVHNLNNHLRIIVKYHDDIDGFVADGSTVGDGTPTTKIVGYRVEPMSIKHAWSGESFVPGETTLHTCSPSHPAENDSKNYMVLDKNADTTVVFTYDVVWEKSVVEWSQRWDVYLNSSSPNEKVHWYSISNSLMIILFLTVMIAVILLRTLRKVRYGTGGGCCSYLISSLCFWKNTFTPFIFSPTFAFLLLVFFSLLFQLTYTPTSTYVYIHRRLLTYLPNCAPA